MLIEAAIYSRISDVVAACRVVWGVGLLWLRRREKIQGAVQLAVDGTCASGTQQLMRRRAQASLLVWSYQEQL